MKEWTPKWVEKGMLDRSSNLGTFPEEVTQNRIYIEKIVFNSPTHITFYYTHNINDFDVAT